MVTGRPNYPALCVNPHCRHSQTPRPTNGRAHVCPVCEDRIRDALWTRPGRPPGMGNLWRALEIALTPTSTGEGGDDGRQVHGMVSTGTNVNERVSEVRSEITAHLWFLTRAILDAHDELGRPITPPADQSVPGLARWTSEWTTTLASHLGTYTTAAVVTDTLDLHHRARAAAYPSGERTITTRQPCLIPHCPGVLTAHVGGDILPDLTCNADRTHQVPAATWSRASWKRRLTA